MIQSTLEIDVDLEDLSYVTDFSAEPSFCYIFAMYFSFPFKSHESFCVWQVMWLRSRDVWKRAWDRPPPVSKLQPPSTHISCKLSRSTIPSHSQSQTVGPDSTWPSSTTAPFKRYTPSRYRTYLFSFLPELTFFNVSILLKYHVKWVALRTSYIFVRDLMFPIFSRSC